MVERETFKNFLKGVCERNEINLSGEQLEKFYTYYLQLAKWNRVHNLTALRNWKEIALRHFCDSLTLVKFFEGINYSPSGKRLVDVGSGAGFPGVPLKIYYGDDLEVHLVESVSKKCSFLRFLKTALKVPFEVHCTMAENLTERFDIAVSRALEVKGKKVHPLEYAYNLLSNLSEELISIMAGKNPPVELVKKLNLSVFELNLPDFKGQKILYTFKGRG